VDAVNGCVRCRDLRDALDQGDDQRLLELLEDLYDETGAEPELTPRSGGRADRRGEASRPGRPASGEAA
jgi:hypothetical protein